MMSTSNTFDSNVADESLSFSTSSCSHRKRGRGRPSRARHNVVAPKPIYTYNTAPLTFNSPLRSSSRISRLFADVSSNSAFSRTRANLAANAGTIGDNYIPGRKRGSGEEYDIRGDNTRGLRKRGRGTVSNGRVFRNRKETDLTSRVQHSDRLTKANEADFSKEFSSVLFSIEETSLDCDLPDSNMVFMQKTRTDGSQELSKLLNRLMGNYDRLSSIFSDARVPVLCKSENSFQRSAYLVKCVKAVELEINLMTLKHHRKVCRLHERESCFNRDIETMESIAKRCFGSQNLEKATDIKLNCLCEAEIGGPIVASSERGLTVNDLHDGVYQDLGGPIGFFSEAIFRRPPVLPHLVSHFAGIQFFSSGSPVPVFHASSAFFQRQYQQRNMSYLNNNNSDALTAMQYSAGNRVASGSYGYECLGGNQHLPEGYMLPVVSGMDFEAMHYCRGRDFSGVVANPAFYNGQSGVSRELAHHHNQGDAERFQDSHISACYQNECSASSSYYSYFGGDNSVQVVVDNENDGASLMASSSLPHFGDIGDTYAVDGTVYESLVPQQEQQQYAFDETRYYSLNEASQILFGHENDYTDQYFYNTATLSTAYDAQDFRSYSHQSQNSAFRDYRDTPLFQQDVSTTLYQPNDCLL